MIIGAKDCPFCGSRNLVYVDSHYWLDDVLVFYHRVVCDMNQYGCGASSGYCRTEEEALKAWNRRKGNETV